MSRGRGAKTKADLSAIGSAKADEFLAASPLREVFPDLLSQMDRRRPRA